MWHPPLKCCWGKRQMLSPNENKWRDANQSIVSTLNRVTWLSRGTHKSWDDKMWIDDEHEYCGKIKLNLLFFSGWIWITFIWCFSVFLFFVTLNLKVVCFFVFCTSAQLQTWNPSIPTCDYAPTVQKSLRPAYACIYNSDIWTVESPQPQNIKDSAILRITALSYNLLLNQSTVCWKVLHHYLIFCHFVCYHQC